jgi:hypothetical protein
MLHGHGEVEVSRITDLLGDVRHAYESALVLEIILDGIVRDYKEFRLSPDFGYIALRTSRRFLWRRGELPFGYGDVEIAVPRREQLVLASVKLASPGVWEFLGSLNPLEQVRKYLQDRHERKKDAKYREAAEERRMHLENQIRENQVLSERISMMRDLGATDRDLAPLLNRLLYQPLSALDRHQDQGVIEGAEIVREVRQRDRSR